MLQSIVTGILIGTSYIPFPPWAAIFALVPLWAYWMNQTSWKRIFWTGWISQFLLTLIGFHWIAHTAKEFGMLPWPIAGIVLILFCCIASLHYPISGLLWYGLIKRNTNSKIQQIAGLVLCMGIAEQFFPTIFPWNFGYTWLWSGFQGFQWADVFGFEGLSQITFALNGVLLWAWINRSNWRMALLAPIVCCLVLLGLHETGKQHGRPWQNPQTKADFQVVQANIGNLEKHYAQWGKGFRDKIVDEYIRLTDGFTATADFTLWPETAYPDTLDAANPNSPHWLRLHDFLERKNITLLTGGYSTGLEGNTDYNAFFALSSQGWLIAPPYRKTILLAFGEYFPGGEWFPFLYKLVPTISKFGRGQGPVALKIKDINLGPQICYEGLYSDFSRGLAQQGSEIIVNVTNDSWFGQTFEPYQHLYMTLARAIENRRPLVRATNTGISTAILASGEIRQLSPIGQTWTGTLSVPYQKDPPPTFFTQWGEWLGWIEVLLLILLVVFKIRSKTPAQ